MPSGTLVANGESVDYAHTAAVNAGDILKVGTLILIAAHAYAANQLGTYYTRGRFTMPKASGGSTAIAYGAKVYWDNTNGVVTATASGNTACGHATSTSVDADTSQEIGLEQIS